MCPGCPCPAAVACGEHDGIRNFERARIPTRCRRIDGPPGSPSRDGARVSDGQTCAWHRSMRTDRSSPTQNYQHG